MKIAFCAQIIDGPWGGGNNFLKALANYLKNKGCEVYFELKDD